MNVDDVIKILLAIGVTFSLVGISYQVMRLIDVFTNSISDLRKALQNISKASDMIIEDYDEARGAIHAIISGIQGFSDILAPLRYFAKMTSKRKSKDEEEE